MTNQSICRDSRMLAQNLKHLSVWRAFAFQAQLMICLMHMVEFVKSYFEFSAPEPTASAGSDIIRTPTASLAKPLNNGFVRTFVSYSLSDTA